MLPQFVAHRSDQGMQILPAVHAFDKAHLVMLTEEGLIPREDGLAMLRILRETEAEGFEHARREAGGGMHSAEQLLIRRLGEAVGGREHLGRSSGDLGEVAARMLQRDALLGILGGLAAVRTTVLDLAERHLETLMPGYLQGQHAQPVTLAHYLASWAVVLERDAARALEAYRRINVSPAGAAIMTGSDFRLNRQRTSDLLGFDRPSPNAFDAILSHDVLLDSFCVLAVVNANLARWADDILLWESAEFRLLRIPDRFCGTSSILTQMKSPYAPELVKGLGAASAGGLMTALLVEKSPTGLPLLDRQYSYNALWRLQEDTLRNIGWWQELVGAIEWNTERMAELAGAHWAQATDVAGALVREQGLPWRTAHQIVGILVRLAEERGLGPHDVTTELLDEAAVEYHGQPAGLSSDALNRALDARHFVEARDLYGGPAPKAVRRGIEELRSNLRQDEAAREEALERVSAAHRELELAIDALLGVSNNGPGTTRATD